MNHYHVFRLLGSLDEYLLGLPGTRRTLSDVLSFAELAFFVSASLLKQLLLSPTEG